MAHAVRFVCSRCGEAIVAWSDGNPYYLDENGEKQYAYHPDHVGLAKSIGNDDPHICLTCGHEFVEDSRAPLGHCPECGSDAISPTFDLKEKECPHCQDGRFELDPEYWAVS